jgi:hypothetical protein
MYVTGLRSALRRYSSVALTDFACMPAPWMNGEEPSLQTVAAYPSNV